MKNTAIVILALLLLLAGVFIALQIKSAKLEQANRMADNLRFQDAIEGRRAEIAQKQATIDELQAGRVKDSLRNEAVRTALNAKIDVQARTIARLRPLVQPVIDANPDLSELITATDIKIALQDSIINTSALYCQRQIADLNAVIKLQAGQITEEKAISEEYRQAFDDVQKESVRANKRKRFWRTTTAILTVGIITAIGIYQ